VTVQKSIALAIGALVLSCASLAGMTGAKAAAVSDGSSQPGHTAEGAARGTVLQPAPQSLVQDALPAGSVLLDAHWGSFVDGGGVQWVAVWTESAGDPSPLPLHVGVVAPHVEAPWSLFWSTTIATPEAGKAALTTLRLGALDGFAVTSPGDAHGSQLLVERWDGDGFSPLLQQSANNSEGEQLEDLDGDGTPEVIRNESSRCLFGEMGVPYVTVVYRWDGSAFTVATERFPQVLDETDRILGLMRDDQIFWRNSTMNEKACFEAVVAYVARVRGDQTTADAACSLAMWYDPAWTTPSDWQVTAC
jgi:hypothetical protein